MRLLEIPADVLGYVASLLERPALVVACSPEGHSQTRRALRDAFDVLERARFPGAVTVREAERKLKTWMLIYPYVELASRRRAGEALFELCFEHSAGRAETISALLSYGAETEWSRANCRGATALHYVAAAGNADAAEIVGLLAAAGANVNAEYSNPRYTPLALALDPQLFYHDETVDAEDLRPLSEYYQMLHFNITALRLIEAGASIKIAFERHDGVLFVNQLRSVRQSSRIDPDLRDEIVATARKLSVLVARALRS